MSAPTAGSLLSQRIDDAIEVAMEYAPYEGSHHRGWVIDQMVRVLLGDSDTYNDWRRERAPYDWEEGVAP